MFAAKSFISHTKLLQNIAFRDEFYFCSFGKTLQRKSDIYFFAFSYLQLVSDRRLIIYPKLN